MNKIQNMFGSAEYSDISVDRLLIDHVKQYPSLHYADIYTEIDELNWNQISKKMGIQKAWLKRRWQKVRNEHSKIKIYNHINACNKDKPQITYKLSAFLDFLTVDVKNSKEITYSFDDLDPANAKNSFCVTPEMMDQSDDNDSEGAITMINGKQVTKSANDINSGTIEKTARPNFSNSEVDLMPYVIDGEQIEYLDLFDEEDNHQDDEDTSDNQEKQEKPKKIITKKLKQDISRVNPVKIKDEKPTWLTEETSNNKIDVNADERCEDVIFGELVSAMLRKMAPAEKKRAKKEIMNILL